MLKLLWERPVAELLATGLLHPELIHSTTRDTLVQIQSCGNDTCFVSANRTCELGMRQTTGKVCESFIQGLEELTRP